MRLRAWTAADRLGMAPSVEPRLCGTVYNVGAAALFEIICRHAAQILRGLLQRRATVAISSHYILGIHVRTSVAHADNLIRGFCSSQCACRQSGEQYTCHARFCVKRFPHFGRRHASRWRVGRSRNFGFTDSLMGVYSNAFRWDHKPPRGVVTYPTVPVRLQAHAEAHGTTDTSRQLQPTRHPWPDTPQAEQAWPCFPAPCVPLFGQVRHLPLGAREQ